MWSVYNEGLACLSGATSLCNFPNMDIKCHLEKYFVVVVAKKIVQLYYNWKHNVVVEGNIMSDMHN